MSHPQSTTETARAPILYGREAEFGLLREALAGAAEQQGRLVLVGGEAGIGKTALVERLAEEARASGALVLSGHCYDLAATPPYGPWIEVLRGWQPSDGLPELPAALADIDRYEQAAGQDALGGQLAAFFGAVAAIRPLVLLLEDQHWADQASLDLLRVLARQVHQCRMLLVVTYRDVELSPAQPLYHVLPQLVREGRAVRVSLRRLSDQALRRLTVDRYQLPDEDEARLVAYLDQYAEGNPFFTGELLQALEDDAILARTAAGWTLGSLGEAQVPLLVRQVIDTNVARLDETTQRLLQVAAVIGYEAPLDLWCAVAEVDLDGLAGAIEEASRAGLLVESADRTGLRFRHALIREALYDGLVYPRRRFWHGWIAEILASRPDADPDSVAYHFQQASDRRAAGWLVRAGQRAARRDATRDAIERYERALALLEYDESAAIERGWLLCALAEAYRYTDPRRSLALLDAAQEVVTATGDTAIGATVLWSRARIRGFLGESVVDDLREAVARYAALPDEERARVREIAGGSIANRGILAQWLAFHGRYEEAIATARAVINDPSDGRLNLGDAWYGLGLGAFGAGRPDQAGDAFARASDSYRAAGNHVLTGSVLWQQIVVALTYAPDDLPERRRLVEQYVDSWLQTSSFAVYRDGQPLVPLFQTQILEGRWEAAYDSATTYLDVNVLRMEALLALGEIERYRGQPERAWTRVHAGLPGGPTTAPGNLFFSRTLALQRLAADLALDAGDADLAKAWIEANQRWLDWSNRVPGRAQGLLLWTRYHRLVGDQAGARASAEQALERATRPRQARAQMAAQRMLAALDIAEGDHESAAGRLAIALAIADACGSSWQRARTLLIQARLAIATRRRDDLNRLLAEIRAICDPLDDHFTLDAADALERMAAAAPTRTAPPTIAGGLSPRELEVLLHVAKGMTDVEVADALFISPRTVARHLQSVYNKLGVNSRTAATAFAFEHRLV